MVSKDGNECLPPAPRIILTAATIAEENTALDKALNNRKRENV